MCLEILFVVIKNKQNIKGIKIFDHTFLYTAYADDTTFFVKDKSSIKNLSEVFNMFSTFSGLKPNTGKCEIAGIGVLKGVHVAVCGMKCIDLTKESIKILGTCFSYNEKIKVEKFFYNIVGNIQAVLKLWRMRNLTLEGKIIVFRTLAISKLVFQALLTGIKLL